jgi:signal transduction histidine kinase
VKDLSLHLMDIAQNATAAGASRVDISLVAQQDPPTLTMTVADNGRGMEAEFLARVADPFTTTRTTRKVGLGIPLLKLAAEMTGGRQDIVSEPGVAPPSEPGSGFTTSIGFRSGTWGRPWPRW